MINPYAPPQAVKTVSRRNSESSTPISLLSLALVTFGGILVSVICFAGYYLSMSVTMRDLFGFGGMGVCAVGLPIISALTIRSAVRNSWLKSCCILNLLGMVAFVAAVSMQSLAV